MDEDGDESEEIRRDRERFVTAALAFTLKHSRPFLKEFWKRICRVPSDPRKMPRISREDILLEPPAWADLQLKSEQGEQKWVWVVEVKVGAKLDAKQDPRTGKAAFLKADEGYGWHLSNAHKQTKLRYIILCLDGQLPGEISAGLICQIHTLVRTWKHVAEIAPGDKLTRDLFDSLGQLGVYPFGLNMKEIERITVTNALATLNVPRVLDAVRKWLHAPDSKTKWEYYEYPEGGAELGVYVLKTRSRSTSGRFAQLQTFTRPPKEVTWFGYIIDKNYSIKRGVWVYCNDESKKNTVLKCLKTKFREKAESDTGALWVKVTDTCAPQAKVKDFNWFQSVVEEVEKLAKGERLAKRRRS